MRVSRAGVVGAGAMGAAIAELLAFNGVDVVLKDLNAELVGRGLERVKGLVDELVAFQAGRAQKETERIEGLGIALTLEQQHQIRAHFAPKVTAERGKEILARVHGTTEYSDFGQIDLVIEAVFEQYSIKREVLDALDRTLPEHAVIGSNTSSLSISRLAAGLHHARETLVTHFFNPPGTLPLIEVAAGVDTREDVVTDVIDFLQSLRNHRYPMVPIRVRESPAYLVNRILVPVLNEACFALDEGIAGARDIDLAMKSGAGMPMGPFELADLIGLDVVLEVSETMQRELGDPKYRSAARLRQLVDAGHLGR